MKRNIKSMVISIGLCVVLAIVIFIEISIFISGPAQYYDDKITTSVDSIKETYPDIASIQRHVFSYIMYSGEMNDEVYWFNEKGLLLTKRYKKAIDTDKAISVAESDFGIKDSQISLGYGYDSPVYVIENEQVELFLDVDTMKQVFYRKKG